MSYLSQHLRIAYIHRRLKYKRDYPSAAALARDYLAESGDSLSEKTFQRSIESLRNQNAPIEYDRSQKGYYYTDETFELDGMVMTSGDLLALLVIERALNSYLNSPFYEKLNHIFDELKRLLPNRVSVQSSELASNFSIIPEPVTNIQSDTWEKLQKALKEHRYIDFQYLRPGYSEPFTGDLAPYHLVGHMGEWYLLGYSNRHKKVRVYALARFQNIQLSHERFTPPEGFNPEDHIDPSFGIFMKEEPIVVFIKFYPPIASLIKERHWHAAQKLEELEDGNILLKFSTNQESQTLYWVAKWGPNAEILEPESLRLRAKEWFSDTFDRYSG